MTLNPPCSALSSSLPSKLQALWGVGDGNVYTFREGECKFLDSVDHASQQDHQRVMVDQMLLIV